jgi:hypothetical protein
MERKEKPFFEGLTKCSDLNVFASSIAYILSTKSIIVTTTTTTTFDSTAFLKN